MIKDQKIEHVERIGFLSYIRLSCMLLSCEISMRVNRASSLKLTYIEKHALQLLCIIFVLLFKRESTSFHRLRYSLLLQVSVVVVRFNSCLFLFSLLKIEIIVREDHSTQHSSNKAIDIFNETV